MNLPSLFICVCVCLCGASPVVLGAKPLTNVADLRYGVSLYDYYQDDYLAALSELMIAEVRGGIRGHGDNPRIMEGGISLAFGMERKAGAIFTQLLHENRPLEVRNAAWFYLGKLRYLRGDWAAAESSLNNISGKFDKNLVAELVSLQINLTIQGGDLSRARSLLDAVDSHKLGKWRPYVHYNLGAAYSRAQNYVAAIEQYSQLPHSLTSNDPVVREEHLALTDKALTAAGYSQMLQGNHSEALTQFRQVRLESALSNRALLGYGWAAAETGDYHLALRPWQTLAKRSLLRAPTQEAIIAVPYAYEKLGAPGRALNAFLNAQTVFEKELVRIDVVMASLQNQTLLQALKIDEHSNHNWFSLHGNTDVKPHVSYLTELFASNRFQGAVQELRELLRMKKLLLRWKKKLGAFQLMLNERELSRAKKLAAMDKDLLLQRAQKLVEKYNRLAKQIEEVAANKNFLAVASAQTASLYRIVQRAEASIERLKKAGETVDDYQASLQRYRGLLLWTASENFAEHLWDIRKGLKDVGTSLAELNYNQTRLDNVITTMPDIAPYRTRIKKVALRIEDRLQAVDKASVLAETLLRRQVAEAAGQQRARLQHYLAQTRLSIARLYDGALLGQQP